LDVGFLDSAPNGALSKKIKSKPFPMKTPRCPDRHSTVASRGTNRFNLAR
jgi:hypothetical protein